MPDKPQILIVDDDANVLRALELMFEEEYVVCTSQSGCEALEVVKGNPELSAVVLDIRMAKMDGLETATKLSEINSALPIIFHTGYPGDYSESRIEEDLKPFDYVVKGERPARLRRAIRRAVEYVALGRQAGELRALGREKFRLIGESQAMLDVYQAIHRVAETNLTVLITGPTGTGKELVAQAIHAHSGRKGERPHTLNCNHTPRDLVASMLFGHMKGSFSGAYTDHTGLFEYADGGTLFLDEIGDLNVETQGLLLRAIEQGEIRPVGSNEVISVDVRLVCATNRNLSEMAATGEFRDDLYGRIAQVKIDLPPLRLRKEDVPHLIDHFVYRESQTLGHSYKRITPDAEQQLCEYDWPRNVRELETTIKVLVEMTPSDLITADDVCHQLGLPEPEFTSGQGLRGAERSFRKSMISRSLAHHNGNITATARELLLDRTSLRRMMQDLGIEVSQSDSTFRNSTESE